MKRLFAKHFVAFLLGWIGALLACSAYALTPLAEEELADINGQQGIALGLELRVNADANGNPLAGGAGAYIDCTHPSDPCRWALSFANRPNVWLVFSGWSVALKVNDLFLDVVGDLEQINPDPLFADDRAISHNRFFDVNGQCMLADCSAVADIPAAIRSMPAMKISTPATTLGYDPVTNTSSGFTNTEISLNFEGAAAITAVDGYNAPVTGTFIGARIGDVQSNYAGWAFKGDVYVFGY